MTSSYVLTVDISGFSRLAHFLTPRETADYLSEFYALVFRSLPADGWRVVKTMGDCVLICAAPKASEGDLIDFHEAISRRFPVHTHYRRCRYESRQIGHGDYACHDIFGTDLNLLFLQDTETRALR